MKSLQKILYFLVTFLIIFIVLEFSSRWKSRQSPGLEGFLNDFKDFHQDEQQIEMENLPDVIFNKEYLRWVPNNKCAKFPRIEDIKTNNIYWQMLSLQGLENLYLPHNLPHQFKDIKLKNYYLFGAYFDSRGPDVKILGMTQGQPQDLYCNVWFSKGIEPIIIKATYHYVWNKDWRFKPKLLNPYLFKCELPINWLRTNQYYPKAVSLTAEKCEETTNLLKVNYPVKTNNHNSQDLIEDKELEFDYNNPAVNTKDFMVCVKGLDFPQDISYKLIEWIELIRLLGADKIHFYILNVHENVAKVLEHYKQVGWIITEGLSIPGLSKLKNRPQEKRFELIPYNDCFYKHREDYKYVILLDVDEIILPNIGNWKDLIAKMQNINPGVLSSGTSTYSVPNAYFFDESNQQDRGRPSSMLRSLYRSRNITQPSLFVKGFHNASDVVTLHNHFPIECVSGECFEVKIKEQEAKLAHYRKCPEVLGVRCEKLVEDCVKDDGILRFQEDLMRNVRRTVKDVDL